MKRFSLLAISLFFLASSSKADFVTIFQEHLRTYSDFIPLGERLEIHVRFTANNGTATVTLPPELSYTGTYTVWNGPVESITFQGQTATITVEEGVLGGEVWFFAFAKPLSQLPDSAPEVDITISGQETRSFSFKMLYQKVTVTSDTEEPVTAGDIITYTVRISTYPREDLEKSRLTLYPPLGTDLLLDSITGPKDAVLSGGPSQGYSLKWDSNPPTTLEVIYKVQVWDIYIIDPSVKEIVTHPASYRIDAKGVLRRADNVTGDPIEDINFFSGSELTEPLVNKLERNELELTLTPSKTILEVDEEFTVTATIKTINFSRFENARLNEPSIKFLGDQVAQLIESPTTYLPPLTNNQEGSLEYNFKALA